MSLRIVASIVIAVVVSDCSLYNTPDPEICPQVVVQALLPVSGFLTFSIDDANDTLDRTETLDLADEEITLRCKPVLHSGAILYRERSEDVDASLNLIFDCYYETGLRLIIRIRGIPDPRRWQTGEITLELEENGVEITHGYGGDGRGQNHTYCTSNVSQVVASINVEESRGQQLPFPELVDDSFIRRFTIDLEVPSARGEPFRGGHRPCPFVGVSFRASYLLTADDYQHHPEATCP